MIQDKRYRLYVTDAYEYSVDTFGPLRVVSNIDEVDILGLEFGAGSGALGTADFSSAQRDAYSTVDLRIGVMRKI